MGLSRREFVRTLPSAVLPFSIEEMGDQFRLFDQLGNTVLVTLTESLPRVIAGLSIPVSQVTISSVDLDLAEADAFMERFHRYFHRGGG